MAGCRLFGRETAEMRIWSFDDSSSLHGYIYIVAVQFLFPLKYPPVHLLRAKSELAKKGECEGTVIGFPIIPAMFFFFFYVHSMTWPSSLHTQYLSHSPYIHVNFYISILHDAFAVWEMFYFYLSFFYSDDFLLLKRKFYMRSLLLGQVIRSPLHIAS